MKEFLIKNEPAFQIRVKSWKCVNPTNLNAVEFIQECKNTDGEVDFSSTYQFFMTDDEIQNLAKGLLA
jgi:hypothetical protein